jgi:hypothetical protein
MKHVRAMDSPDQIHHNHRILAPESREMTNLSIFFGVVSKPLGPSNYSSS